MALSYYSEFALCDTEQLQSFPDTWSHDYSFDPNDLFSENPNSFLSTNNGVSYEYNHHAFNPIATEFEPFHYQKAFDFDQFYFETDTFHNHPAPCLLQDYTLPEIALPEFPTAPPYAPGGGGSLSAQSIAARQRRRKITEKTQELGKLVPGGQKMNTAEMLQSAYKYIKYLQAQVGLLGLISSSHQENGVDSSEDFQLLVQSPLIQESLYSSENCLVPQKFVEELRSDNEVFKSNPHLMPSVKKEH